jgi:KDO2-lipid IV(A) lauroyltransferase
MAFGFRLLAHLPLWLLHAAGATLGWAVFLFSGSYRHRFLVNARQAGVRAAQWQAAVAAAGCLTSELPRLWLGPSVSVRWQGVHWVDEALARGRGVVFITPHLGCFEVAAQAYAARYGQTHPMTALYRPARQAWLAALEARVRARPGLHTAPTTLAGVKQMLKALKRGDCVGLLPDQVPPLHQGVWAPFFGQAAYTMTLAARLAQQTGAVTLLAWGERLSWGQGYVVHVAPVQALESAQGDDAVVQMNQALEALISQHPGQYLWGYARYKQPRVDALPGANGRPQPSTAT